ncbi:hypothetical protein D3C75_1051680 [compost metagenome]
MHGVDVLLQPVPHRQPFRRAAKDAGMAMGVDQARHQQPVGQAPDLGLGMPGEQFARRADIGNHAVID